MGKFTVHVLGCDGTAQTTELDGHWPKRISVPSEQEIALTTQTEMLITITPARQQDGSSRRERNKIKLLSFSVAVHVTQPGSLWPGWPWPWQGWAVYTVVLGLGGVGTCVASVRVAGWLLGSKQK